MKSYIKFLSYITVGIVILVLSGCTSNASDNANSSNVNIGFKGIYLGGDATKGCAILKSFTKTLKGQEYSENKKEGICRLSNKGLFGSFIGGSEINFKNNKIISMKFDSAVQDKIFNLEKLSLKERAQTLVNNLSWLSKLNYDVKPSIYSDRGEPAVEPTYSIRDFEQGFFFKIYSITFKNFTPYYIYLEKLDKKKVSF